MGKELFGAYPRHVQAASELLGYPIDELCLRDLHNRLNLTQYTQPALYVVNALGYYQWREQHPGATIEAMAGHSLGELCALHAAGCFDFETGLRIVQKRGELMSQAGQGGMAAVLGMRADALHSFLREHQLDAIDLANFNSPAQTVIAGDTASIVAAEKLLTAHGVQCIVLNVSAPFHSRYMQSVQQAFSHFLRDFAFADPAMPVIANATARPYGPGQVAELLARQIVSPVRWTDTIRYLMGRGALEYEEIGADSNRAGGNVLGKLVDTIRRTESPIRDDVPKAPGATARPAVLAPVAVASTDGNTAPSTTLRLAPSSATAIAWDAQQLGSAVFRERYDIQYAYVAGAMYRGIASTQLVVRMGQAGLIGYLGTGGLSLSQIEQAIQDIQAQLPAHAAYGMNLLANYGDPALERATVDLYLKYHVRHIEAAAFMQMTPALVLFRVKGLSRDTAGRVQCAHRVLAKVSRLEVARAFLSPPPAAIVEALRKEGAVTSEQAELAKYVPMAHDLCVEADSGGHTEGGHPAILLPAMLQLKDALVDQFHYQEPICVGLAGGIGTPMAAAAAFVMGADFILTGSINQCTIEAGATPMVKDLLQQAGIHDTAYAPAGDMFETGARIQVLKKGSLFPMRANKLYSLYTQHDSLDAIPTAMRMQLEGNYFGRSLAQVWEEVERHLREDGRTQDLTKAQSNPRYRMSLVFRWYFAYSMRLAFSNSDEDQVNYQVHTGPALGAFNQWVKGTALEAWTQRHVDQIAVTLMQATAEYLGSMTAARGSQQAAASSHPPNRPSHPAVIAAVPSPAIEACSSMT
ncbi:ACP S-malonyltransferase [Dyella jejuensis]